MFHEGVHMLRAVVESYTFKIDLTHWAVDVDCSGGDLFVQQDCLQDVFGRSHSCTEREQTTPASEHATPNRRTENYVFSTGAGGVAHGNSAWAQSRLRSFYQKMTTPPKIPCHSSTTPTQGCPTVNLNSRLYTSLAKKRAANHRPTSNMAPVKAGSS